MAAPTFIQEAETAWASSSATTKTTASFNVQAGDILVACMESAETNNSGSLTASGGSLTWTNQQDVSAGIGWTRATIATAIVDANKAMTVTVTRSLTTPVGFGVNVLTFRGASAVGASAKANVSGAVPSLSLTTTQDNSVVVVLIGDKNGVDGATRAWLTGAGTLTEQTYDRTASLNTVYSGFHADAGTAGADTVGLSTPGGQKYSIIAVEIKGTVSAPAVAYPQLERMVRGLIRGLR